MDTLKLTGTIKFDPRDVTKKHKRQGSWKKVAMIMFDGDICEYYGWFIKRRYNLTLNRPLRGPHISFINDNNKSINNWVEVKKKYNNTKIDVILNLNPKTDSDDENSSFHWWLNIPEEERGLLHSIREEVGLNRPFFGLHMTIGYANIKNQEHSKYLHNLIKNGFIK